MELGIEQLDSYLARLGISYGWLIIFDLRKKALPIQERLSTQVMTTNNERSIVIIRA